MSDKPIQVNDVVMLVRFCCDKTVQERTPILGIPLTVVSISHYAKTCCYCGCEVDGAFAHLSKPNTYAPVHWLKRLDPDALRDDVPETVKVRA